MLLYYASQFILIQYGTHKRYFVLFVTLFPHMYFREVCIIINIKAIEITRRIWINVRMI